MSEVTVVGAGLAGCEAAKYLARRGRRVTLVEMKPNRFSPAHKSGNFAELVCSNSLKAARVDSAAGLLKAEMRLLGSLVLEAADTCAVAAGGALAVDRELFSRYITNSVESDPLISVEHGEYREVKRNETTIIATGPLTDGALYQSLSELTGGFLSFFDAAAPIVSADSLDMDMVFAASRYGHGGDDYLNCYFDKAGYEEFQRALCEAKTAELHSFDSDGRVYEGCMPIERLAKRGRDAMRFGPMKPVGLTDPRTGRRPWAAVQLRRENAAGTLFNLVGFQTNLKFSEQERVFGMIPGLAHAEFARYGVMHRNSFVDAPNALDDTLSLKAAPSIYLAGQITGFEGYCESAACGLLAARAVDAALDKRRAAPPPRNTMCGALLGYITSPNRDFQPMGANMGILPPTDDIIRDKRLKYAALAERALCSFKEFLEAEGD